MALVREKKRFGDILIAAKAINDSQLTQALEEQKKTKQKLGTTLISLGFITEVQIKEALHSQMGIDMVDLATVKIPVDVLNLVKDSTVLKRYTVMPFEFDKFDSNYLRVAMADPMDLTALDDLQMITGMQIAPVIATSTEVLAAIDKYYGHAETQAVADLYAKERGEDAILTEKDDDDESVENAPIVLLVKKIIEQAVRMRASDIHIEPTVNRIRVRYRIDGVLQETGSYQLTMLAAFITRIKIIAGMDISEKRKPQDGRITQVVDRFEYDIRASVLPTVFGEKVVMRLTAKTQLTRNKADLGLNPEDLARFDKIFSNPNGIILVTGPTGSGKSTTLYTALSELNTEGVNIITVEDPVEANIDGINQVQVNPKADLTFATALRSILRQDPDIIMIGEIRDQETASIAVTASITGHLVVSTLHTNSAASSLTRLENMGIESYLLADSTVGVMAQRLARRLCNCKTCRPATPDEKKMLGVRTDEALNIYEPRGCVACNETGYKGRIGVYEIMPITPRIRNVISNHGTTEEIERIAIDEGMNTLKMSCAKLVRQGVTSLDELRRIVYANDEEAK